MRRSLKLAIPESSVESAIRTVLELDNWRCFHFEENFSERKQRTVGEPGMPDLLAIRYEGNFSGPGALRWNVVAEVLWIEAKRVGSKAEPHQKLWHSIERKRGAVVLVAGVDFPATGEDFIVWYAASGLQRRAIL